MMRRIVLVLLLTSAGAAAETLYGFMFPIIANNTGGYSALAQGVLQISCADTNNAANDGKWVIGLWLDDPTMTSGNSIRLTQSGSPVIPYGVGATLGSINPNDGQQHNYYAKCISKANPGAGDFTLYGSPMPYRYANGNIAPAFSPNSSAITGRLGASQLAIFANTQDPYSVGASGSPVCAAGSTATGSTPILSDGVVGYYANARGVPCSNIYEISIAPTQSISQAALSSALGGIFTNAKLANSKLQAIALGWVQPANVIPSGVSLYQLGIVGVFAMGNTYLPAGTMYTSSGKGFAGTFATQNPYFNAAYSATPATTYGVYPTMMLAGESCPSCNASNTSPWSPSVASFQTVVRNAIAATNTNPSGAKCTSSITKDQGYGALTALISPNSLGSGLSGRCTTTLLGSWSAPVDNSILHGQANNLFYIQGSLQMSSSAGNFIPGAGIGVVFSSYGGYLPTGGGAQTVIPIMLNYGAAAAYGSSYEPGSVDLQRKYPSMELVVPFYTAGQTAVEALWRGTAIPWMSAIVGDPLASPYGLSKGPAPQFFAGNGALNFAYQMGGNGPAAQTITLSSSSDPIDFAAAVSGASWLTVTPSSGMTPQALSISVNPSGLAAGSYNGTIQISSSTGASMSLAVSLAVAASTGPGAPTVSSIVNAASYVGGAIAPGEIVTIGGTNLGPATLVGAQLDANGNIATQVAGVQAMMNGVAAPVIYTSSTQLSVVAPYELSGAQTASIWVTYQGQTSNLSSLPVAASAPGIFAANSSGSGPAAFNSDFSPNGPNSPAPKNGVVIFFLTGEGQTNPTGVTGTINAAGSAAPSPVLPVSVLIDGQSVPAAAIPYAGGVPGVVEGLMQLNVQIPASARSGDLPIQVTIGGSTTQSGITVSVQ